MAHSRTPPLAGGLSALIVAALAAPAFAAPVTVPLDQARRIPFAGQAASVLTGNDKIADVAVVDERTVVVFGKQRGMTNVIIFDRAGRPLFESEVLVAASDATALVVNRGGAATTYACTVTCQALGATPAPASAAVQASPAPAAATAAPAAVPAPAPSATIGPAQAVSGAAPAAAAP